MEKLKGKIQINYGMDNFCYVKALNGKRVNLTEWMKKFDGKDVEIEIKIKERKATASGLRKKTYKRTVCVRNAMGRDNPGCDCVGCRERRENKKSATKERKR